MDKWLNNTNAIKIAALLLGILLWAVVHLDEEAPPNKVSTLVETKVIDNVKIIPTGLDEQRYLLNSLEPQVVRIQVRGQRSLLSSATPDTFRVNLDLRDVKEGTHTISLTTDLPYGLQLVAMEPSAAVVEVEELQTKEFDVNITTEGTPADGYKAGTPIVQPSNRVHVTLPTTLMPNVASVNAVINIEGVSAPVKQKRVKLTAYDKAGRAIPEAVLTPPTLEVEVPVTRPFKTVPLQVNFVGDLPAGQAIASFEPNVHQVALYGPQSELDKLDFYDSIQVDVGKLKQSGTMSVKLPVPPNIEKIEPSVVQFDVKIVDAAEKELTNVPIAISGESDQLKATLAEPAGGQLNLKVIGAPELLNALEPDDVQLIANVSGLPPGNHQVPLVVNLPNFVKRADSGKIYATVLLEEVDSTPVTAPPDSGNKGGADGGTGNGGPDGAGGSGSDEPDGGAGKPGQDDSSDGGNETGGDAESGNKGKGDSGGTGA